VIPIEVPPLRRRPEDIGALAQHFLTFYSNRYGKRVTGFTEAARRALMEYEWPGNVRELQNVLERAVILSKSDKVPASALPRGSESRLEVMGVTDDDLPTLEGMERRYIAHVLENTDSIEEAAEVLGVAPSTLWRRRRKYNL